MANYNSVMPEEQELTIHERIQRDRKKHFSDNDLLEKYKDYAAGKHVFVLTDKQKDLLRGVLGREFSDNVCHQIIAEAADRLHFLRWDCEDSTVADFLSDLYTTARLSDRHGEVHYDCLRDGNHAIAVNWDNDRQIVRVFREPWWDGKTGVFISYDDNDEPAYAVREWVNDEGNRRRAVWFEDRLERYISRDGGGTWEEYLLPEDDGRWPVPWVKRNGDPLHIPYVHFPNAGRGSQNYGMSELSGGVLGFQDQLNDLQYAMSAAGRLTAFQMIWMTGVKMKTDPKTGEEEAPNVGAGQVLHSPSSESRFGAIPAGDMSQLIRLYETKLKRVAQMTRTPFHMISGGDWPSGEALLRAEQPAVGKATRQIQKLASCWTAVGHKAVEVWNTFSTGQQLNEDVKSAMVKAVFEPPERRDILSKSAVVNNLGEVVSLQEKLRLMGYTPEQVDKIMEERAEEQRQALAAMQEGFDRGTSPGTNLPGTGPSQESGDGDPEESGETEVE